MHPLLSPKEWLRNGLILLCVWVVCYFVSGYAGAATVITMLYLLLAIVGVLTT